MIYLDNAATSFPKPPRVIEEVTRCMRSYCGNPGRGSHRLAMECAERIYQCREEVARFLGVPDPTRVIFTMNTTMSLNIAIKGLLRQGDHVLISDLEHNAVLRPIYKLAREGRITYDVFPSGVNDPFFTPAALCVRIARMIHPNTRMLIMTHASNVCSFAFPLEEIGALCQRKGILFVVDAAQSAGHLPIDLQKMKIDALCLPGHKGLLGPQGSGILALREGIEAETLLEGGSGFHSLDPDMPPDAPERYEAGTLSTPAIVGLLEGIREIQRRGLDSIQGHVCALNTRLCEHLSSIPGVTLYAPHCIGSVLLFNIEGIGADRVGELLDQRGFCLRTGFHCAALAHKTLVTKEDGAVRVSPGIYNTSAQIDSLAEAIFTIQSKK